MFLDAEDLKALTGYAQRARQIAQLRQMGIPFWINAAGLLYHAQPQPPKPAQPDLTRERRISAQL